MLTLFVNTVGLEEAYRIENLTEKELKSNIGQIEMGKGWLKYTDLAGHKIAINCKYIVSYCYEVRKQ